MIKFRTLLTVFFLQLLILPLAHSFPEMVRYGYVNCNSCHIAVTGGGILNDYGREIARDKLAFFKSDNEKSKEAQFLYGALSDTPIEKILKGGGDIRSVYYYFNNDTTKVAQTIFMQGDLELAAVKDRFAVVGTLGVEQPIPGRNVDFISRRHYVSYGLTDEFALRVGKFVPAFGINTPDHVTLTRDPLSLGDNFESYNLEASYIGEQWNFIATGIMGQFDSRQALRDRGFALQASYAPTEKIKLGGNVWYGKKSSLSRWIVGPYALVGITPHLTFQTEIDRQSISQVATNLKTSGIATTQKLSYELHDGLWVYGLQEYGKSNFDLDTTRNNTYGIGFQIFPRAHFEFNLAYERVQQGRGTNFYDYAWIMSHIYL